MKAITCMCKRCAGTGVVFAGVKPFRFKRCPRCSGKGGKVADRQAKDAKP